MSLMWILIVIAVIAIAGGAFWYLQQNSGKSPAKGALSPHDRFVAEEIISPAHTKLLTYMQEAFHGHAVLFRPSLATLISVRSSANREDVMNYLASQHVDFVVCEENGKPVYAFDLRERDGQVSDKVKKAALAKSKLLQSAGIKLLRIQRSINAMPPVHEFHQRLAESLNLETPRIKPHQKHGHHQNDIFKTAADAQQSDLANLSDLMGLTPESDDSAETEWIATRQQTRHGDIE